VKWLVIHLIYRGEAMIKIEERHYHSVARLLTECFLEDQLVAKQVAGIEKPEEFLEKLFFLQMPVLHKTSEIYSLDDSMNSVIVGYEKKKYKPIRVLLLSILCQFKFSGAFHSSDLKVYAQNCREAIKDLDLKWQKKYVKGNYYYIKVIAIAKSSRGKGDFRSLITPIINACKEKDIPIVLDTNTPENVPIYQHFGFELIKTITKEGADFCQYCFIKQP
jgi:hypothetical protein